MRVVTATIALACVGFLGCAGIGGVFSGRSANSSTSSVSSPPAGPTPVEAIAARFPSFEGAPKAKPAAYSLASLAPTVDLDLFSPTPLNAPIAVSPAVQPVVTPTPRAEKTSATPVAPPAPAAAKHEAAKAAATAIQAATATTPAVAASAPHHQSTGRPGGVLNDAQIAGIKKRLNLTPAQEAMWPAVASALRNIVYTKNAEGRARTAQPGPAAAMAYIDPNSDEVRQLKYAALPLIMQLNDDQRHEVKMMAHVMGLESVASQF